MSEQKQAANNNDNERQKTAQKGQQSAVRQVPRKNMRTLLVRGYFVDDTGNIRRQQATGDYIADVYRLMSYNPAPKIIVIAGRGLAIAVACEVANKCQDIGMVKIVETKVSQTNGDQRKISQIEIVTVPANANVRAAGVN